MTVSNYQGLTTQQANALIEKYGFNELPSAQPKTIWKIALEVLKEPMFILLISCGVLYILLGDYKEGVVLSSSIFLIIGITFYQHNKTERALEALKKLSSPRALVIRDGIEQRIAGREVVIDDIIILNEGDRVPADAVLMEVNNLTIDESILTGESVPVKKSPADNTVVEDHSNLVYSSTLVVQGRGIAKVTHTGSKTEFGKIGSSLQNIKEEATRLQSEMKVLIRNLSIIGVFACVLVVLLFYYTRGNIIRALLTGLSSAMSILPEEFPVVLTIFLALGAWRLSKKNVLTRKPAAIETLGSATVLCSDKTGTITQNKMEVVCLYNGKDKIVKDTFHLDKELFSAVATAGSRASQKKSIDPMEIAIHSNYNNFVEDKADEILVKEYPLSKELLAMTMVLKNTETDELSVSCKGAPETIFKLCKMADAEIEQHKAVLNEMAASGLRVLGVANAIVEENNLPHAQHDFDFKFLGLIGLEDAIRPEVPNAVKECLEAGVRVVMITGDFPVTAKSIARQIGLDAEGKIMTGKEINELKDEELKARIKTITVFARVVPEQKLRIVQALKANGEIVAMTGDGVNDAPALKAANIGIAMGGKGTDVAREASSLVLLDDNFASIVGAIRLGRKIFDNLQKSMSYILAVHIPIIGLALLPAFNNKLPIFLLPLHIVFLELIIDPICSIAFESEQEERGIMKRPPRNATHKFFGRDKIMRSLLEGLLLLAMVLIVYFSSLRDGHTEEEIRTIAFSALIIGNMGLIITNLSKTRNFIVTLTEKNNALRWILVLTILILFLVITVPSLEHLFSFSNPGVKHLMPSFMGSFAILFIFEFVKWLRNR